MTTMEAPRRRRRWPWFVALVVVLGLLVVAWFIADSLIRGLVTTAVRAGVVQQLGLPADQQVDVEIEGMMVPQLVGGTFHDVTVSSDDVALDGTAADVSVQLNDVEYRGDTPGKMASGTAVVTFDQAQLQSLLQNVDGLPTSSVGLKEPDITATVSLSVFGAKVPVGVAMEPSASNGALVLTPQSFSVAGATMTAADVSSRFGSLAGALTQPRSICIADRLPAGVTLTGMKVAGDTLVADLSINGDLAVDTSLQQKGTCS